MGSTLVRLLRRGEVDEDREGDGKEGSMSLDTWATRRRRKEELRLGIR